MIYKIMLYIDYGNIVIP